MIWWNILWGMLSDEQILLGSGCLAVLGAIFLPAVIADVLYRRTKRDMER